MCVCCSIYVRYTQALDYPPIQEIDHLKNYADLCVVFHLKFNITFGKSTALIVDDKHKPMSLIFQRNFGGKNDNHAKPRVQSVSVIV